MMHRHKTLNNHAPDLVLQETPDGQTPTSQGSAWGSGYDVTMLRITP